MLNKYCFTNQAILRYYYNSTLMKNTGKLREQRIRAGLTQAELAKMMGVSRTTVSFVETGKHPASPGFRKKALKALSQIIARLSLDDIF